MFITLKNGSANDTMEQVLARNPATVRERPRERRNLRRPACEACKKSKLRCLGPQSQCDRCLSRSIPCIFPEPIRPRSGQNPNRSTSGVTSTQVDSMVSTTTFTTPSQTLQTPIDSDFMPANSLLSSGDNANGLNGGFGPFTDEEMRALTGGQGFHTEADQDFLDGFGAQALADTPMEWFNPDNSSLTESTTSQEYLVPDTFPQQKQRTDPGTLGLPSFASSNGNRSSTSQVTVRQDSVGCDCITVALGVVQQLDDDHFKLSSLSLDQVIQLQKWIHKSAGASLVCDSCKDDSKALTVVVIICERLTEMFECIHRRIDQATQETLGGDPNLPRLVSMADEQLYPSLGTKEGCDVRCNTALFSMEFQKMYSGEEQVHMIKVLLRLQMRNLQAHLVTLKTIYDSKANEARRHKIASLTARLSRAASAIDTSLQNLLEHQRNER